jgi:hypothetical protein
MSLQHFLLIFDHSQDKLVSADSFKSAAEALQAYSKAEREHAEAKNLEIVLIGSDSIETVQRTHANYFEGKKAKSKYLVGI